MKFQKSHAHHIVMKKGYGTEANAASLDAQKILQLYGIDPIFGYDNLVRAPPWNEHTRKDTKYAPAVLHRLIEVAKDKGTKNKVLAELHNIAMDFIGGLWK